MSLLVLLLVAAPELPLGPYARAGIPVILESEIAGDVMLDDWPFRVFGPTIVHPPRVPCAMRDGEGRDLGRLEPVPEGMLLLGVVGDAPRDLTERIGDPSVRIVPIRVALRPEHWPALDVFDRILVMGGAAVSPALELWSLLGGSLVVVGDAADLDAALSAAGQVVPNPLRAAGNARPDLYDMVKRPKAPTAALRNARWLIVAAAVAMAIHLLLGAAGLLGPRLLLAGLATVAIAGGAVGLGAHYRPLAEGRIEVDLGVRRRVYHVYVGVGPGAVVAARGVPIHYRRAGAPWWETPDRSCPVPVGLTRIFRTDEPPDGPGGAETAGVPSADPGEAPVLFRLRGAPQR